MVKSFQRRVSLGVKWNKIRAILLQIRQNEFPRTMRKLAVWSRDPLSDVRLACISFSYTRSTAPHHTAPHRTVPHRSAHFNFISREEMSRATLTELKSA